MNFLKKPPSSRVKNRIRVKELGGNIDIAFHPFIKSFNHSIGPNFSREKVGLVQVEAIERAGLSDSSYSVSLVLPAVDEDDARANFFKVQRFKKLVTPTLNDLLSKTGRVKFSAGNLMRRPVGKKYVQTRYGFITDFQETFEFDVGFANGFPKQIEISFTFVVDRIFESRLGKKTSDKAQDTSGKINGGSTNPKPNDSGNPPKSEADKAKAAAQARGVGTSKVEKATRLGGTRIN